jgi:hypothetical protein
LNAAKIDPGLPSPSDNPVNFSATLLVASIAGDNRRKPLAGCFIVVFCPEAGPIIGIVILHSGWIATGKVFLAAETAISAWQESSQWLCLGSEDAPNGRR